MVSSHRGFTAWGMFLFLAIVLIAPSQIMSMRDIPDIHLKYPVLIEADNSSVGSGFYLRYEGYLYLVTANHVLFNPKAKLPHSASVLSHPVEHDDDARFVLRIDIDSLSTARNIVADTSQDIVAIRIASLNVLDSTMTPLPGVDVMRREGTLVSIDSSNTEPFDSVLVSNEVYILGYPRSLLLAEFHQLEADRPLLRKGIIAGKNASKETLILDCPVYPGNSGGPVVQREQVDLKLIVFKVIGMVVQFVPFKQSFVDSNSRALGGFLSNSGYAVAVPIDAVLTMLRKSR